MSRTISIWEENRQTLLLAAPIIAGQIGQMMMAWADTIMIGQVGIVPLAACSFANTIVSVFLISGFGLLSSVTVRASQAFGGRRHRRTGEVLRAGLSLALAAGLALPLLIQSGMPWLHLLGQPPEVVTESRSYLLLIGWSLLPVFLTVTGKHFSEALSKPWQPFWIVMGGVLLNILLNWVLIHGKMGLPAMGLTGAGVATLLARMVTAVALLVYLLSAAGYRPYLPVKLLARRIRWRRVLDLTLLGLPVAAQLLGEVGAFTLASLMMGWIGVNAMAAHQIAITCAATTFMIPLGLSMAVTVRVGQALGAGERERIRKIGFGAIGLAVGVMAGCAALFILSGEMLASLFVTDPDVIALTVHLLIVAGLFQMFDGCQVVGIGALRGLADVRFPMAIVFGAYWIVSLPISYGLAFHLGYGAVGIWSGLAIGLAVAAGALACRLWWRTQVLQLHEETGLPAAERANMG